MYSQILGLEVSSVSLKQKAWAYLISNAPNQNNEKYVWLWKPALKKSFEKNHFFRFYLPIGF